MVKMAGKCKNLNVIIIIIILNLNESNGRGETREGRRGREGSKTVKKKFFDHMNCYVYKKKKNGGSSLSF